MGYFRLFRRIKIAPGVTVNVSKSGLSTSFGPRGAKVTVGKRGIRKTVGIPGTGMYYTSLSSPKEASPESATPAVAPAASTSSGWKPRTWVGILIAVVILAAAIGSSMGGNAAGQSPSAPPAAPGLGLGLVGQGASPLEATPAPTDVAASPATASVAAPTTKAGATPKPTAKPKSKSTTAPASTKLSVKVNSRTASVPRNSTATVSIKTSPNARCSIEVDYKSGPSTAAGLGDKTASSSGTASWSWKVGSNTTRGTWPIFVTCDLGSRSGGVDTSFTVR